MCHDVQMYKELLEMYDNNIGNAVYSSLFVGVICGKLETINIKYKVT